MLLPKKLNFSSVVNSACPLVVCSADGFLSFISKIFLSSLEDSLIVLLRPNCENQYERAVQQLLAFFFSLYNDFTHLLNLFVTDVSYFLGVTNVSFFQATCLCNKKLHLLQYYSADIEICRTSFLERTAFCRSYEIHFLSAVALQLENLICCTHLN